MESFAHSPVVCPGVLSTSNTSLPIYKSPHASTGHSVTKDTQTHLDRIIVLDRAAHTTKS